MNELGTETELKKSSYVTVTQSFLFPMFTIYIFLSRVEIFSVS